MQHNLNKQFIEINHQPVISRTLAIFENHLSITGYLLVSAEKDKHALKELTERCQCSKLIGIATGGPTRQASVLNGLYALADYLSQHRKLISSCVQPEHESEAIRHSQKAICLSQITECDETKVSEVHIKKDQAEQPDPIILVHDGARCFADQSLIDRVIAGITVHGACGAAMPVQDTIKKVTTDGRIIETPARDMLRAMQTPQGALFDLMYQAYRKAEAEDFSGTDDLSVLANSGLPVYTVPGSEVNIKITTPFDLLVAEAICRQLNERQGASSDNDKY